jgi:DNA-binding NtrC family response regulator
VATTILAVDDSVTMRKVLEITFAGPEFRCITVPGADAALDKLKSDKPAVVVADVTLEGKNGYDLCKAIKQASPSTPVLILSSKQNPYDSAKGSAAQADDYMDKPFDSTQMLEKVKKLLASPSKGADPKPAPETPKVVSAAAKTVPIATTPAQPIAAAAAVAAAAPAAAGAAPQRAKTMLYNPGGVNTPVAAPAAKSEQAKPAVAVAAAATGATNGQMQAQLEALGLTPAQVDGVLALSRDVIERVVWEVVPVLAETLIKEEIARLTK